MRKLDSKIFGKPVVKILSERQKVVVLSTLVGAAILLVGLKQIEKFYNKLIAARFVGIIKTSLEYTSLNSPRNQVVLYTSFKLGNVRDTLTVNRIANTVTSEKNFRYRYKGNEVKCNVRYTGKRDLYSVECAVE